MPNVTTYDLDRLLPEFSYRRVMSGLASQPFRRLSTQPEITIRAEDLCQSVDVNRRTGPQQTLFDVGDGRFNYCNHSLETLTEELDRIRSVGIHAIYLRVHPFEPRAQVSSIIENFVETLSKIRAICGPDLFVLVDSQGLCMGSDLRWGLRDGDGNIEPEQTLSALAALASAAAQSGASAVMTIGRINFEATVARAALDRAGGNTELWAFSTNSETPSAYFGAASGDVSRAITGQKILVGNIDEMLVRSLVDISEGVDVFIQKPIENLHVPRMLRNLSQNPKMYREFINQSHVVRLMEANGNTVPRVQLAGVDLYARLGDTGLGAYEVSGSYLLMKHVQATYSPQLAASLMDELYKNVRYGCAENFRYIIGRNMVWYLQHRRLLVDAAALSKASLRKPASVA